MMADLRLALRTLARSPGFAAAIILITAVGIGAVTTMFSVLRGVVLQPLPFPQPDRLVALDAVTDTGAINSLSALDYFDYRDQCPAFESLAARSVWQPGRTVLGRGEPERVTTSKVSGNYFRTLGVRLAAGRAFAPEEEIAGGRNAVVIGHRFWQEKFGGDPDAVGRTLALDGAVYDIIGVTPADFDYPSGVQLWLPLQRGGHDESGRGNNNFVALGRLAAGADLTRAQSQVAVVAARIAAADPAEKRGWTATLTPLHEKLFGGVRPTMLMLMGATLLVLLIACANLSSLLLARALARQGEMAVRLSLGASPATVARQLLVESIAGIALGAAAGIGCAHFGLRAIKTFGPSDIPRLASAHIDGGVLVVAILATALAAIGASLVPALRMSRLNLAIHLRSGSRATGGRGQLILRRVLVAAQMALSLILLVVTGLLLQSALRLQRVPPGFDPAGLLAVNVQIPDPGGSAAQVQLRFQTLLERLRHLPGVVQVAGADQLPPAGGPWNGVHRGDRPPQSSSDLVPATRRTVTPGFFQAMRIPLLAGRDVAPTDARGSPPVTVISQALARRLFPGENPVGRILTLPWGDGIPLQIVGVAGDVRDFGVAAEFRPAFYLADAQLGSGAPMLRLVIRTGGEPRALLPSVRAAVRGLEKDAVLFSAGTMTDRLSQTMARNRFSVALNGVFAAMAVFLAAFGLYGLMAFLVGRRAHEIGIRVALGAQRANIYRLVLGQGLVLALAGILGGAAVALAATRFLGRELYGIGATDPLTFLLAALLLAAAAVLACWLPARRAARVDPMVALRAD
jgi:predicted permease